MRLDSIDKKLLNFVQAQFPLTKEPYTDLGQWLGIDGSEVICRIEQLKAKGIIRQISPVLDARRLAYQPILVAMRVGETELDTARRLIGQHPRVSHGYERDHYFNLWLTLVVSQEIDIEAELEQLTSATGAEVIFALPAVKVFKIGAYFDMDEDEQMAASAVAQPSRVLPREAKLSQTDRLVINELQQDLPLVLTPFTAMAARISMDEERFLAQCQSLLQRGIMRRFGASISHNRAGFKANAMACWIAPPDIVDTAGQKLASLRAVSHCYERKTNPLWQYNLFAMIHSHTRKACQDIASEVSHETSLTDYVLLFSTKELKKVRVKYLV